jgi:hypothetical protein
MVCPVLELVKSDNIRENGLEKVVEDSRAAIAIARINWLHSHFNIVRSPFIICCDIPT